MRRVLVVMLMLIMHTKCSASCPDSCVVCSEDAIICHKLSNIIEVPGTTKALMLTDGLIDTVDDSTLSELSNMTLLGLSNNLISNIMENAFRNLTVLRTLLLDHNRITSLSIHDSTFASLQNLEILQLGHNALRDINGSWFRDMRSLLILQLGGNLVTRLDSATFESSNLEQLEVLDLSDNLIEHVAEGSFRGLPRLRNLDLSRNKLRSAPNAFSYLSWLSALNLDINQWNCTCELRELSSFLSSYIQEPDKVLYNGRQLLCISAANPAVQTVLQLTEANCVPPNENITVLIKVKDRISMQRYARDISLAASFFFAGGVGLTIGALYILFYKLALNKRLRPWSDRTRNENGGISNDAIIENQDMPQWDFNSSNEVQVLTINHPGQGAKLLGEDQSRHRPWLREGTQSGMRPARPVRRFACHECTPPALAQRITRGFGGSDVSRRTASHSLHLPATEPNTWEKLSQREDVRRALMQPVLRSDKDGRDESQYQRPKAVRHKLLSQGEIPYEHMNASQPDFAGKERLQGHGGSYWHGPPTHGDPPMWPNNVHSANIVSGNGRDVVHTGSRPENESVGALPDYLTVSCVHCHKAYEYTLAGRNGSELAKTSGREASAHNHSEGEPPSRKARLWVREDSNENTNNYTGVKCHGREYHQRKPGIPQRNVTFNLAGSDVLVNAAPRKKSYKKIKRQKVRSSNSEQFSDKHNTDTSGEKTIKYDKLERGDYRNKHNRNLQSNRLLKVKINLNPLRKTRVHPNTKTLLWEDLPQEPERMSAGDKEKNRSSKGKLKDKGKRNSTVPSEIHGTFMASGTKKETMRKSSIGQAAHEHSQSIHSTKASHNQSISRPKTSRPKISKSERVQDTEQERSKINEKTPHRKHALKNKKGRDALTEGTGKCQINFLKSQEEDTNTEKVREVERVTAELEKIPSTVILLSTTGGRNLNQIPSIKFQEQDSRLISQNVLPLEFNTVLGETGAVNQFNDSYLMQGQSVGLETISQNAFKLQAGNKIEDVSPAYGAPEEDDVEPLIANLEAPEHLVQQQHIDKEANQESGQSVIYQELLVPVSHSGIKDETKLDGIHSGISNMTEYTEPTAQGSKFSVVPALPENTEPPAEDSQVSVVPALPENTEPPAEDSRVSVVPALPEYTEPPAEDSQVSVVPALPENTEPSAEDSQVSVVPALPENTEPSAEDSQVSVVPALPENTEPPAEDSQVSVVPALPENTEPPAEDSQVSVVPALPENTEPPAEDSQVSVVPALPETDSTILMPSHSGLTDKSQVDTETPSGPQQTLGSPHTGTMGSSPLADNLLEGENLSNNNSMDPASTSQVAPLELLPPTEGSPKRKIHQIILPEKTSKRPQTALEKKIR